MYTEVKQIPKQSLNEREIPPVVILQKICRAADLRVPEKVTDPGMFQLFQFCYRRFHGSALAGTGTEAFGCGLNLDILMSDGVLPRFVTCIYEECREAQAESMKAQVRARIPILLQAQAPTYHGTAIDEAGMAFSRWVTDSGFWRSFHVNDSDGYREHPLYGGQVMTQL